MQSTQDYWITGYARNKWIGSIAHCLVSAPTVPEQANNVTSGDVNVADDCSITGLDRREEACPCWSGITSRFSGCFVEFDHLNMLCSGASIGGHIEMRNVEVCRCNEVKSTRAGTLERANVGGLLANVLLSGFVTNL